jgi:hypothetical protein
MVLEFGIITCCGVFGPVYATYRLGHTRPDRVARTLSAWTVATRWTTAALTALWGVLADLTGTRTAIALAGAVVLLTPFLLPRRDSTPRPAPEPAPASTG